MSRLGLDALLFALGLYVSLRAIAACYRVLDLWYTIRTAYPGVVRGLVVWLGSLVLLILGLEGEARTAFVAGLLAYAGFYLGLFRLRHRLLARRPPGEASQS